MINPIKKDVDPERVCEKVKLIGLCTYKLWCLFKKKSDLKLF